MLWIMNFYCFQNHGLGKGKETGVTKLLVPSSPIMPSASRRPLGFSFIVRTVVYRHISRWRGPRSIKLERLLG